MYCEPEPTVGAPAIPAPGTDPCQLVPSLDVSGYSWTIGWCVVASRIIRSANTWSAAVRPVVVAARRRLVGVPLASTRLPLASTQVVEGLAVGGNAVEKAGGATPMTDALSGARSELCWETWWAPTRSIQ